MYAISARSSRLADDLSKKDLRHYHRHVYKGIAEQIRSFGVSDVTLVTPDPPKVQPKGPTPPRWQTTRGALRTTRRRSSCQEATVLREVSGRDRVP